VLLRAIPYRDAERLVAVWGRTAANPQTLLTYREYEQAREGGRSLDALGLWLTQSVNLTGGDQPQRITGAFVTGSFFDVLGLTAERGRLFTQKESQPGNATPVVVITHAFWQRRFGGDPAALGSSITLNGAPMTVIGILASPFDVFIRLTGRNFPISSARVRKLATMQTKFVAEKVRQAGFTPRVPLSAGLRSMTAWFVNEGQKQPVVSHLPPARVGGSLVASRKAAGA